MRYPSAAQAAAHLLARELRAIIVPVSPAFHHNKRLVKTASVAQVRKPIYTTSIARWKKFSAHLNPLLEIVKGYRES